MVRKRTAEMAVFKDGSEVASTPPPIATNNGDCDEDDNENNKRHENNSSHRLPPPRKKTRVRKGSPVAAAAAAAPRTRRVALKEKATNPSSSDVLHPIDKDESFYGKQPTRRRANLPTNDKAKALEPSKACSVSIKKIDITCRCADSNILLQLQQDPHCRRFPILQILCIKR